MKYMCDLFWQAEDVKCLLSDAMMAHTATHPPSVVSTPSNTSSPASPNTSNTSPLSQANASLLANSPAGSGDGAVNKRSIAEAQGAGDTRIILPGMNHIIFEDIFRGLLWKHESEWLKLSVTVWLCDNYECSLNMRRWITNKVHRRRLGYNQPTPNKYKGNSCFINPLTPVAPVCALEWAGVLFHLRRHQFKWPWKALIVSRCNAKRSCKWCLNDNDRIK